MRTRRAIPDGIKLSVNTDRSTREWVREQATREGISDSAFVDRILQTERARTDTRGAIGNNAQA